MTFFELIKLLYIITNFTEFNLHTDNPAGRLLNILEKGKEIPISTPCKVAWGKLLDVKGDNLALLMSRLGKVMELPDQIINQIKSHYPNQNNTHQHWSQKINHAFASQNLNGSWKEFYAHIDAHTINYLSMSVDLLDMKDNTEILSAEKLSEIYNSVNSILVDVLDSDLELEVKKYIVKYLRKIIISIEEYKISGATPIIECVEGALGHAFVDENYRNSIQKTEIGKQLITVLTSVASVVTVAIGLPQLPDALNFLLSSPTN